MKEIEIVENPDVSVIIPLYNAQRWVGQTLDSLSKQTYGNFEIIVVDDGSTDDSKRIVDLFSYDRRLKYFHKENGGTGSALNFGHERASAPLVTWCAADNIYYPPFIEVLRNSLIQSVQHGVELIYSDFQFIGEDNRPLRQVLHEKPQTGADLIEGYDVGMSFMYTKALWDKTGPYWNRICEDFHWAVRAAQHTKFGLLKAVLAGFRVHQNQLTNTKKVEADEAAKECKELAKVLHG